MAVRAFVLGDGEQQEREREKREQRTQSDVRLQRPEPHEEGEDGPSQEEDGDGGRDVALVTCVQVAVVHPEPRDENGRVREPERAVGRERRGAERVARSELPHAGEKLRQPAVEHRQARDDVRRRGDGDPEDAGVVAREHERRHGEAHQAQRRRVGDGGGVGRRWVRHVLPHLGMHSVAISLRHSYQICKAMAQQSHGIIKSLHKIIKFLSACTQFDSTSLPLPVLRCHRDVETMATDCFPSSLASHNHKRVEFAVLSLEFAVTVQDSICYLRNLSGAWFLTIGANGLLGADTVPSGDALGTQFQPSQILQVERGF